MYNDSDRKSSVMSFLDKANPKIRKKFYFIARIIADEASPLTEPYVKHFTIEKYRGLYEMRLKASGIMIRIIYYEIEKNIILLHAFVKKDKRDTVQALDYSLKLADKVSREYRETTENLTEVLI